MNSFKIGTTEFGVGEIRFSLEEGTLDLEINGDTEIFSKLSENENGEWNWAISAPRIYFEGIPFQGTVITLNDAMAEECDFALYMMEHNPFEGVLEITEHTIRITGNTDIMGKQYPVNILVARES